MIRRGSVVILNARDVATFNSRWPASPIKARERFVEFNSRGELIDHNFSDDEDGTALLALVQDAEKFWRSGKPFAELAHP